MTHRVPVLGTGSALERQRNSAVPQSCPHEAAGEIRYFIFGAGQGGGGGQGGTRSAASAIAARVTAHHAATTVGGLTVYYLSTATS